MIGTPTFRFALGAYLAVHFGSLLPWAGELFSLDGAVASTASPLLSAANVLWWADGWAVTVTVVTLAALLAGALAAGWHDRSAAILLAYLNACLLGRNPLIANPALPYLGWLLLAHAALPRDSSVKQRRAVFLVAWTLLAVGYGYSGAQKLGSPSWIDGSAFSRVLENPLARDTSLRTLLLASPPAVLQAATWGVLGFELAFAPLAVVRAIRPWAWLGMVVLHLCLMAVVSFADLTVGMLVVHLATFDPAWRPREPFKWRHRSWNIGSIEHPLLRAYAGLPGKR
jgi:hypothetical protein